MRALRTDLVCALLIATSCLVGVANGQEAGPAAEAREPAAKDAASGVAAKVEVQPTVRDEQIRQRLERILRATGWFENPRVRVDEGVVFLSGLAQSEQYKRWAGELGRNTRDVVAVVNQLELQTPSAWDFREAVAGLEDLWRGTMYALPFVAFGLIILLLALGASALVTRVLGALLRRRVNVSLLREVLARAGGIAVFLLGLYIVLRVSGLTRLALTVIGGTGLLGLVVGIAFRDITENFLASIFLSVRRPFRPGDLVELAGTLGYVQQLNARTTVFMTLSGNQVQIPNATVYKSTLRNYTSNPNRREDFTIGIGYDAPVPKAQEAALAVLAAHPAVLKAPEPWVLVDSFGAATVNLRVYFWLDGSRHSWLKVKSSAMRLVKRALQDEGIPIPDEAREVVFPSGVPVQMLSQPPGPAAAATASPPPRVARRAEAIATAAEGGLDSDAGQIEIQARQARDPEQGANLLSPPPAAH